SAGALSNLHSFPTRRSSDLGLGLGGRLAALQLLDLGDRELDLQLVDPLLGLAHGRGLGRVQDRNLLVRGDRLLGPLELALQIALDRKSTRLNSSHVKISYAV